MAELFDLVHDVVHFYPRLHGPQPRFVIVHAGERLLPELSPMLGLYAQRKLGGRGIEFRLGARVSKATPEDITLDSGETIPSRTLAWTAGNRPNPLVQQVMQPPFAVEPTMQVPGAPGLWALGDCARIPPASHTANPHPSTTSCTGHTGAADANTKPASVTTHDADTAHRTAHHISTNTVAVLGGVSPMMEGRRGNQQRSQGWPLRQVPSAMP
ncbi:FAD-dependent oxidoreductase [Streptomyces sp. NPDC050355]|uniref:FAD-dependent oxidoreductase n=1 Tax=Streptomyces sp. NPDC050355 TaxID=3365609 RepID=UPI00378F1FCA